MENTQEENKHKLQEVAFDISVSIESFARGVSEAEADLQEAKSSAKKLIEKIDEYLESLKPKFKVGDYVTEASDDDPFICKIEEFEGNDISGRWYCVSKKYFDKLIELPISTSRLSTPEEIAEYESALQFHKHGRNPFEVKKEDLMVYTKNKRKFFVEDIKNWDKLDFTSGNYELIATVEELDKLERGIENE